MTDDHTPLVGTGRFAEAGEQAQARREMLHSAIGELTAALDASDADVDAWRRTVAQAIAQTRATIAQHVRDAEAPDGLLAQVIDEEPAFGFRVEAMKDEHQKLLERSAALVERSQESLAPQDLRDQSKQLIELIDRHRHRSADLLLDTYDLDLSAAD